MCAHSERPNGEQVGVNRNNLLLRGCIVRNTATVVGIVVYAGKKIHDVSPSSPPPLPSLSISPRTLSLFHSIVHAVLKPLFSLYSRSCFGLMQLFLEPA